MERKFPYIKPPANKHEVRTKFAHTNDIIKLILYADKHGHKDILDPTEFIRKSDRATARYIHSWIYENINYVKDEEGKEVVKGPGQTVKDGFADCKSMAVLAGSILKAIGGIDYFYRFGRYLKKDGTIEPFPTHVYVVVKSKGKEIILDATSDIFDYETPYKIKIDKMPTQLHYIHGRPTNLTNQVRSKLTSKYKPFLILLAAIAIYKITR